MYPGRFSSSPLFTSSTPSKGNASDKVGITTTTSFYGSRPPSSTSSNQIHNSLGCLPSTAPRRPQTTGSSSSAVSYEDNRIQEAGKISSSSLPLRSDTTKSVLFQNNNNTTSTSFSARPPSSGFSSATSFSPASIVTTTTTTRPAFSFAATSKDLVPQLKKIPSHVLISSVISALIENPPSLTHSPMNLLDEEYRKQLSRFTSRKFHGRDHQRNANQREDNDDGDEDEDAGFHDGFNNKRNDHSLLFSVMTTDMIEEHRKVQKKNQERKLMFDSRKKIVVDSVNARMKLANCDNNCQEKVDGESRNSNNEELMIDSISYLDAKNKNLKKKKSKKQNEDNSSSASSATSEDDLENGEIQAMKAKNINKKKMHEQDPRRRLLIDSEWQNLHSQLVASTRENFLQRDVIAKLQEKCMELQSLLIVAESAAGMKISGNNNNRNSKQQQSQRQKQLLLLSSTHNSNHLLHHHQKQRQTVGFSEEMNNNSRENNDGSDELRGGDDDDEDDEELRNSNSESSVAVIVARSSPPRTKENNNNNSNNNNNNSQSPTPPPVRNSSSIVLSGSHSSGIDVVDFDANSKNQRKQQELSGSTDGSSGLASANSNKNDNHLSRSLSTSSLMTSPQHTRPPSGSQQLRQQKSNQKIKVNQNNNNNISSSSSAKMTIFSPTANTANHTLISQNQQHVNTIELLVAENESLKSLCQQLKGRVDELENILGVGEFFTERRLTEKVNQIVRDNEYLIGVSTSLASELMNKMNHHNTSKEGEDDSKYYNDDDDDDY